MKPELSEGKKVKRAGNSKLPILANVTDDDTMRLYAHKMKRAREIRAQIDELKEELEVLVNEFGAFCQGYNCPGFRIGLTGYEYHGWATRKTLDRELLLEQGVTADQIAGALRESAPFLSYKFIDVDLS